MILSEESISFSCLSFRLLDPASWDPDDLTVPMGFTPEAEIATGYVVVTVWEVFVPITLRVNYLPRVDHLPEALSGRVTYGSGELWIDEIESGSKRSGATVAPGSYSVQVDCPASAESDQIYTITLFDQHDL